MVKPRKTSVRTGAKKLRNMKIVMCFLLAVAIVMFVIYNAYILSSPAGRFSMSEDPNMKIAYALSMVSVLIIFASMIILFVAERLIMASSK